MKTPKKKSPANTLATLKSAALNPRKITNAKLSLLRKQLAEFGDLGGIVFSITTGELVSGHQRVREFHRLEAEITIDRRFDPPTKTGTVAEGSVMLDGERFGYREVAWDANKARAALLAANNHAGEWDNEMVRNLVLQLDESNKQLTGFSSDVLKEIAEQSQESPHPGFENDETDKVLKCREVNIVPIALTAKEWKTWEAVKAKLGKKLCKEAFLELLGKMKTL